MARKKTRNFSNAIPCAEIYAVRVFELNKTDGQYVSWMHFGFVDAWFAFSALMECMEAEFVGGCIDSAGHRYFAKANGVGLQLTPFFYFYDEE